jgi:hypothetical protein
MPPARDPLLRIFRDDSEGLLTRWCEQATPLRRR